MTNEEMLSAILTANISKEQRDALLGEYANILIKEKTEKTWEEKNEEVIEKSRMQSSAVKDRLKEYEIKAQKEEKQRIFDSEIEEKVKVLEQIQNKNGERIYSDLKDASAYEILSIYESYEKNNPQLLKEIESKLENKEKHEEVEIVLPKENKNEELKQEEPIVIEPVEIEEKTNEIEEEPIAEPIELVEKPVADDSSELIEKPDTIEENPEKKLKVVDFEENMKKFPKSFREFEDCGGLAPEKDGIKRRIVKAIKNKWAEIKNKKAGVSEKQLLNKPSSFVETAPIQIPEIQVSEDQLLKEDTPVVNGFQKIDANRGIIANSIVPEQQLLNIEDDPVLKQLEERPIIPEYRPAFDESLLPEAKDSQEMSFDEIYNPVNMQMNQGKSI